MAATDGRGVTVTRSYDDAGQLVGVAHPDGQVAFDHDAHGRRTAMTDPTGTTAFAYDPAGRLVEVDAPQGTVGYAYDAAGQRTAMTQPDGQVAYTWDPAGRLVALAGLDGQTASFAYDRGLLLPDEFAPFAREVAIIDSWLGLLEATPGEALT